MKNIFLALLVFCSTLLSAQNINNKNCPYDVDNMVKTNISGMEIHSYLIDIYPDSIVSKNYVANSNHHFDIILTKPNKRKYHVVVTEYDPEDIGYMKIFEFDYKVKSGKLLDVRQGIAATGALHGLTIPADRERWMKDIGFSTDLNEEIFIKHFKKMLNL